MEYILDNKQLNLGIDRLSFGSPFDASISHRSIYNGHYVCDLLIYNENDYVYEYEDQNVNIFDTIKPIKEDKQEWFVWLIIKKIIYSQTEKATICVSSPLSTIHDKVNAFLGFDILLHSEQKHISGFLITPEYYRDLLGQYQNDETTKGLFIPRTVANEGLYTDYIVSEISEESLSLVFDFFIKEYYSDYRWIDRKFFVWSSPDFDLIEQKSTTPFK